MQACNQQLVDLDNINASLRQQLDLHQAAADNSCLLREQLAEKEAELEMMASRINSFNSKQEVKVSEVLNNHNCSKTFNGLR